MSEADGEQLIRPQRGVIHVRPMIGIHHVEKAMAIGVPEARVERGFGMGGLIRPACGIGVVAKSFSEVGARCTARCTTAR